MLWLSPCNSSLPLYSPLCLRNLLSWASSLIHPELSAKVVLVLDSRTWLFAHLANFLNSSRFAGFFSALYPPSGQILLIFLNDEKFGSVKLQI